MPTLRFEGRSDDTFGEYGHFRDDYICGDGEPIDFVITMPGERGGVVVTGQHARRGIEAFWQIGVASYDPDADDLPLPRWPMRIERSAQPYSPQLVIDAPEGVQLRCLQLAQRSK